MDWITKGGKHIPIGAISERKRQVKLRKPQSLNKKELSKKIYKDAFGMYTLDLPIGYITDYGTKYIQRRTKKEVMYELDNFVSKEAVKYTREK